MAREKEGAHPPHGTLHLKLNPPPLPPTLPLTFTVSLLFRLLVNNRIVPPNFSLGIFNITSFNRFFNFFFLISQGQVEVFFKGSWGGVCGSGWDIKEANVVCHELRFQGAVAAATS